MTAVFRPSTAFADLDLSALGELPEVARSEQLFLAGEAMRAAVEDWCRRVATQVAESEVAEDRRAVWEWLQTVNAQARPDVTEAELVAMREQMSGCMAATFELFDLVGEAYPAFLRGETDGPAILMGADARPLWLRYFHNDNLAYGAINDIVGHTVATTDARDAKHVLEVGGGCGSGAERVLPALSGVERYRFTEPVPWFLLEARNRLRDAFPDAPIEYGRVDLNRPLPDQDVEDGSLDLVLAVNVVHAVRDLRESLVAIRKALRPGGRVVLGEAVRASAGQPVFPEFVFLTMPEFRNGPTDPEVRPTAGFMQHGEWARALAACGFEGAAVVPDLDRLLPEYPGYTLAGLTAVAP